MFSHYLFWNLYCNCSFKHIWDTLNKRCSFASNFVKVDLFMCRKSQGIFYSFFCLSRYFWQTIHLPSPSLNCLAVGWGGVCVCLFDCFSFIFTGCSCSGVLSFCGFCNPNSHLQLIKAQGLVHHCVTYAEWMPSEELVYSSGFLLSSHF